MSRAAARRGLGRGLASLIPDSALHLDSADGGSRPQVRVVPLDEIVPNPEQPRAHFAPTELRELSDSIAKHGVLSPLLVRKQGGHYVLIAGERRFRAAGLAGLTEVPVMVREAESAQEQLELALVENLQRADLNAVESARGYARLVQTFGLTQEQVAERVGKDRSTIANMIRLLKLPDFVLDTVQDGRLSMGHARALIPLTRASDLRVALERVIDQQLSVRATERFVASLLRTRRAKPDADDRQPLEYATKLLRESLHTDVQIRPRRKGGGRILIEYGDGEELERLIRHLRSEG